MPTKNPTPLHPIETASRDEIAALQLKRMQWSLSHAYDTSHITAKVSMPKACSLAI